jgi:hypothetical protein
MKPIKPTESWSIKLGTRYMMGLGVGVVKQDFLKMPPSPKMSSWFFRISNDRPSILATRENVVLLVWVPASLCGLNCIGYDEICHCQSLDVGSLVNRRISWRQGTRRNNSVESTLK